MHRHRIPLSSHLLTATLYLLLSVPLATQAQTTGTGSRVSGSAIPRQVVLLSPPTEIMSIRKLLAQGEVTEAHRRATEYLAHVRFSHLDATFHYYAYNALCAVETHRKELEAAMAACDEAIDIFPGMWSALNNRGTVKLLDGDYQGALADYHLALEGMTQRSGSADIIRHNIEIAESRIP